MILTTLGVLASISWRLTLLTLGAAPMLLRGDPAAAQAGSGGTPGPGPRRRGELTSTVAERLGAMKLIRAYGGEGGSRRASATRRSAIASG